MTLLCGFLVLGPTMATTADGFVRRWVDVFWTASPRLRTWDPHDIKRLYFGVLLFYATFGLVMLSINKPLQLVKIATNIMNYALGFSCLHTLVVNMILLPQADPPRLVRADRPGPVGPLLPRAGDDHDARGAGVVPQAAAREDGWPARPRFEPARSAVSAAPVPR